MQAHELLRGHDIDVELGEHEMLTDITIVGKVVSLKGEPTPRVLIGSSQGIDWITQLGLLRAAASLAECDLERSEDE